VLFARSGGTERAVALIEGNVAWACSKQPGRAAGRGRLPLGLADRARVHHLLQSQREAADRRRIGQLLVQSGAMTERTCRARLRHQVIEIFLGLLVAQSGAFLFLRGCDRARLPNVFALDTEALLLDGLRRLDEMELFRGRVSGCTCAPAGREPAARGPAADVQAVPRHGRGRAHAGADRPADRAREFETTGSSTGWPSRPGGARLAARTKRSTRRRGERGGYY